MKYSRLTQEQFKALQQEFINFLAAQSITGEEWIKIKENTPEVAEQELDVFSDLVWEGVLGQTKFLENISPQQLFLFRIDADEMSLIVVKVSDVKQDITTSIGYKWLQENYTSDEVEFLTSVKKFSKEKKLEIFALIQQGAVISNGELFTCFNGIINN